MPEEILPIEYGLRPFDYALVVAYLVITFGVAAWMSRRQKATDDYFLGGRKMPWFAVGLSIMATLMSTQSYIGVPGEFVRHGIGLFFGYLAIPFSATVVFRLWVPFFMRLRLTSAYEYLEQRFSGTVRVMAAALFLMFRVGWMSMVIFVVSQAVDTMKGPDLEWLPGPDIYWWIIGIGVASGVYAVLGGIEAVIWTDVLQFLLMVAGAVLALGFVFYSTHTGPVDWWRTAAANMPEHVNPPVFSLDLTVRVTIVGAILNNFAWTVCTHGSDQVVLQRYFSTTSLAAARRSYLTNLFADLSMLLLLAVTGLAILAFYLNYPHKLPEGMSIQGSSDKLFLTFLATQLPVGCAGLIMAGFLCDAMQTLESGVNSMAAVVSSDFINRFRTGHKRLISDLTLARVLAVVIAAAVTLNACWIPAVAASGKLNIIDLMPKMFNMFLGPLAALFFIGMFLPHCSARSTIPAVIIGLGTSFVWSWWRDLFGTDYSLTITLAIVVPCVGTLATAALLGALLEGVRPKDNGFSWWAVMRRPPNP